MVGFEVAEEVHPKAAGLVCHLAPIAFRGGKVTLPLDRRRFEGTGPGSQLPRAGFCQRADFLQVPHVRSELGPVLDETETGRLRWSDAGPWEGRLCYPLNDFAAERFD